MNQADIIAKLREQLPKLIAEEICSVQPMPPHLMSDMLAAAKSEEWLIANEQIDGQSGLLWRKK
jgi:hypothetical protein